MDVEAKLQILLENLPLQCKHYDNSSGCQRGTLTDDVWGDMCCEGEVLRCNISKAELEEKDNAGV